jgi:hypothetical protein
MWHRDCALSGQSAKARDRLTPRDTARTPRPTAPTAPFSCNTRPAITLAGMPRRIDHVPAEPDGLPLEIVQDLHRLQRFAEQRHERL